MLPDNYETFQHMKLTPWDSRRKSIKMPFFLMRVPTAVALGVAGIELAIVLFACCLGKRYHWLDHTIYNNASLITLFLIIMILVAGWVILLSMSKFLETIWAKWGVLRTLRKMCQSRIWLFNFVIFDGIGSQSTLWSVKLELWCKPFLTRAYDSLMPIFENMDFK